MQRFVEIGPPVPEKKIFEGFLPYVGVAAILVMWPRCHEQAFVLPTQGDHIKFGLDWASGFREEDVWNCEHPMDGRDGWQMPEHG